MGATPGVRMTGQQRRERILALAAEGFARVDADSARGVRTRIHAGLFDHLTEANNR